MYVISSWQILYPPYTSDPSSTPCRYTPPSHRGRTLHSWYPATKPRAGRSPSLCNQTCGPNPWIISTMLCLGRTTVNSQTESLIHVDRRSYRTDSRFAPSQWETALQSNAVSDWLGTNIESALFIATLSMKIHRWRGQNRDTNITAVAKNSNFQNWTLRYVFWFSRYINFRIFESQPQGDRDDTQPRIRPPTENGISDPQAIFHLCFRKLSNSEQHMIISVYDYW